MKGSVKVLNAKGHTETPYDTETGITVEAEAILAQARGEGSMLFDAGTQERITTRPETTGRKILSEHEEVIVVPPMAGG